MRFILKKIVCLQWEHLFSSEKKELFHVKVLPSLKGKRYILKGDNLGFKKYVPFGSLLFSLKIGLHIDEAAVSKSSLPLKIVV